MNDSIPAPAKKSTKPLSDILTIREGDSPSTRKQKNFLRQLSWEQKISLTSFILFILVIPLTLAAVYAPTRLVPQAKWPKTSPGASTLTPTPTPTFMPVYIQQDTVVPAP